MDFNIYLNAVENLEWNFSLMCAFFELNEAEMEQKLGCRCEYGLFGYLEVDVSLD